VILTTAPDVLLVVVVMFAAGTAALLFRKSPMARAITVGQAEVDEGVLPHRLTNWFTTRLQRLYDISTAA
jgi:hypothetical protein